MNNPNAELEYRVLLLAPTVRDAEFSRKIFADAGIACDVCQSIAQLCEEATQGAGLLLLAQEVLLTESAEPLARLLANQPPWSDLPVLLLAAPNISGKRQTEQALVFGAVTYLKRPIEVLALVSNVQAAIRDRSRQYAVREYLLDQESQATSLIEADRRKDEFLATLAHELRNPLAPLRSGIDFLSLGGETPDARKEVLQVMDRQLQQMVRLIDDLLDVARITKDKLTLKFQRVELQQIVQNSVEATRQLIDSSSLNFTLKLPNQPVFLDADSARMSQVLSNLLNNAAKYSEANGNIELRCEVHGERLLLIVEDTGIGIPSEMLESIFEMFSQVDHSLQRSRGGLGIGLTLVRRIVQMHGGRVVATSRGTGMGSQFTIDLPIASLGTNSSQECLDYQPAVPITSKRILVVDDTRGARVMVGKLLEKLGQQVWVVDSAQEALHQVEQIDPDVIFSDIGMPEIDGYELAARLRKLPIGKKAVLVAMTGYGQEQDRIRALQAGFDQHLVKPVSIENLREMLTLTRPTVNL